MITEDTVVQLYPECVEFRTPTSFGCQVVKVWTCMTQPRIAAYSEWILENERQQKPLSLMLSDIYEFCQKAWQVSGKAAPCVSPPQELCPNPSDGD